MDLSDLLLAIKFNKDSPNVHVNRDSTRLNSFQGEIDMQEIITSFSSFSFSLFTCDVAQKRLQIVYQLVESKWGGWVGEAVTVRSISGGDESAIGRRIEGYVIGCILVEILMKRNVTGLGK